MLEQFFSINYTNRSDLFENLTIWKEEKYQKLQGTFPAISFSFADIKETTFAYAGKFSDLNNLEVVTTTVNKYADAFGFTQEEVSEVLREYGMSEMETQVKNWYDGFTFGTKTDIYNPWSIIIF